MRTLFVGGLAPEATGEQLRSIFSAFGALEAARVVVRAATGQCRGFGYVTFSDELAASAAMSALNGRVVEGNRWRVDLAG
jgi:nucleolar protein 4